MNEINIKSMQTQINNVKNELRNEMKTLIQASMYNQTNELKNMMASFFQMNTASTSGSRPLPSNTIANPKGEMKAITIRSGLVLDGPSVPMPPPFINPEEDERAEETLTDPKLGEFNIKVPPTLVQKAKPPSQRNYVVHQRDPIHPNIPYSLRMHKQKKQDKDEIQIHKFWQMFKQLHINITLVDVLILIPKPFLRTARALIDVHGEEMILRDDDIFDLEGDIDLIKKLLNLDSTKDLPPPYYIDPLSGNPTSFPLDHLLEEFADELALITFPPGNDDLPFYIEYDLRKLEYFLNHDPTKEMDSILEDSVDKDSLADSNNNLFDSIPEMFTDEHTLDYSSPPLYDEYDDDLFDLESDNDDAYNDPFDSKEDKIKESKLLIDELDLPRSSDFLPSLKYDSFLFEDFSEVDALPLTDEDKVFNLNILIHENLSEVITRVAPDKNGKKISISHASLILEDFNPPLYELPFNKEVIGSETLLSFLSKNEEKIFKPGILTSKEVHTSLLLELSHQGSKSFKVIKIFESLIEIFPCSYGEDICKTQILKI
nr:hypothetical protein [Tanacetum cinerariifolium]